METPGSLDRYDCPACINSSCLDFHGSSSHPVEFHTQTCPRTQGQSYAFGKNGDFDF
jgi:hypothetical protein